MMQNGSVFGAGSPNMLAADLPEQVHHEVYTLLEENLMKLVIAGMENQRLSNLLKESRAELSSLRTRNPSDQASQVIIEQWQTQILVKDREIRDLKSQLANRIAQPPSTIIKNVEDPGLLAELNRLRMDNNSLESRISQLQVERNALYEEKMAREASAANQAAGLNGQIARLADIDAELKRVSKERDGLRNELESGVIVVELTRLKLAIDILQEENQRLKAQEFSFQAQESAVNLQSMQEDNLALKSQIQRFEVEAQKSAEAYQALQNEYNMAANKVTFQTEKANLLTLTVEALEERFRSESQPTLEQNLQKDHPMSSRVDNQITELNQALEISRNDLTKMNQEKDQLLNELVSLKDIQSKMESEVQNAIAIARRDTQTEMLAVVQQHKDQIQLLTSELEAIKATSRTELNAGTESGNDRYRDFAIQTDHEDLTDENVKLRLSLQAVQTELEDLKRTLRTSGQSTDRDGYDRPSNDGGAITPTQDLRETIRNYEKELGEMYNINKEFRERVIELELRNEKLEKQFSPAATMTVQPQSSSASGQKDVKISYGQAKFAEIKDKVIEELKGKLIELQGDREFLRDQYYKSQSENVELKQKAKHSHSSISEHETISKYHRVIEDLASKLADKEAIVAQKENEIGQLRRLNHGRNTSGFRSHRELDSELDSALSKIYELERQLKLVPEFDQKIKILGSENKRLEEYNRKLTTVVAELESKIAQQAEILNETDTLRDRLLATDQTNKKLMEQISSLANKNSKFSSLENDSDALKSEIFRLNEENGQLKKNFDDIQAGMKLLQGQLKECEDKARQIPVLVGENDNLKNICSQTEAELMEANSRLEVLAREVSKSRDAKDNYSRISEENSRLHILCNQLESLTENLQTRLRVTEEEVRRSRAVENQAEDLKADCERALAEKDEFEKKALTLEGCKEVIPELERRIQKLVSEARRGSETIAILQGSLQELQNQLYEAEKEAREGKLWETRFRRADEDRRRMEEEFYEIRNTASDVEAQQNTITRLESRYISASQENVQMKARLAELSTLVEDLRSQITGLEADRVRIATLESVRESMEREIRLKEETIRDLRRSQTAIIEETERILDQEKTYNNDLVEKFKKLDNENISLAAEKRRILLERDGLAAEVDRLRADLDNVLEGNTEMRNQNFGSRPANFGGSQEESRAIIAELRAERERLERENSILRSKLGIANAELTRLPDIEWDLAQKKEEIIRLCLEIRSLDSVNDEYKRRLGDQGLDESTVQQLERQGKAYEAKLRELASALDRAHQDKEALQTELARLLVNREMENNSRVLNERDAEIFRLRRRVDELEGGFRQTMHPNTIRVNSNPGSQSHNNSIIMQTGQAAPEQLAPNQQNQQLNTVSPAQTISQGGSSPESRGIPGPGPSPPGLNLANFRPPGSQA